MALLLILFIKLVNADVFDLETVLAWWCLTSFFTLWCLLWDRLMSTHEVATINRAKIFNKIMRTLLIILALFIVATSCVDMSRSHRRHHRVKKLVRHHHARTVSRSKTSALTSFMNKIKSRAMTKMRTVLKTRYRLGLQK
jgi:hypothetical protein